MSGWMRIAWEGFREWITVGKYVGLLAVALVYLWSAGRHRRNRKPEEPFGQLRRTPARPEKRSPEAGDSGSAQRTFRIYGVCAVCLCICPVSAAVLMKYQTNFYAYEWIWSAVPLTALLAWAGVMFLEDVRSEEKRGKRLGALLLLCALPVLCGGTAGQEWGETFSSRQNVQKILLEVTENGKNKDICLWAPKSIMEYARAVDGNVRLVYGRNLWETALDAFSYDVYGEGEGRLCQWMQQTEEQCARRAILGGEAFPIEYEELTECLETAAAKGVTCILLPGEMDGEILEKQTVETAYTVAGRVGLGAESGEGYYLLRER